jgi:hypothetical protein
MAGEGAPTPCEFEVVEHQDDELVGGELVDRCPMPSPEDHVDKGDAGPVRRRDRGATARIVIRMAVGRPGGHQQSVPAGEVDDRFG